MRSTAPYTARLLLAVALALSAASTELVAEARGSTSTWVSGNGVMPAKRRFIARLSTGRRIEGDLGGVVAGSSSYRAARQDDLDQREVVPMGNRGGGKAGQGGRKKKGPRMVDAQGEDHEEDWEEFEKRGEDEEVEVDGDEGDDGVGFRDSQTQAEWEYYKRHGKMPPASTQSMSSSSSKSKSKSSSSMRQTTMMMRLRGGGEGGDEERGGEGNKQGGGFMSGLRRIGAWLSSGIAPATGKDDITPPLVTGSPLFNICPPSSGTDDGADDDDGDDDATRKGGGGGGKIKSVDGKGEIEPKKRGSGRSIHSGGDGEGEGGGGDGGDGSRSGLKKRNVAVFFCYDGSGFRGSQYIPKYESGGKAQDREPDSRTGNANPRYQGSQVDKGQGTRSEDRTVERDILDVFHRSGAISESNAWTPAKFSLCRASRTDRGVHAALNVMTLKLLLNSSDLVEGPGGALPDSLADSWNKELPGDLRILGAVRAEKAVKARTATSLRTYEYLIPMHALKGKPPRELERVMGRFVGNHRFGNFASKISQFDEWKDPSERRAGEGSGEMGWPLLPLSCRNGQQVMRRVYSINVTVQSVPERGDFAVVRMTGASFVYHQIRKMIGMGLAVVRDEAPEEALVAALEGPLLLSAPLAPSEGLLLSGLSFWDQKRKKHRIEPPKGVLDKSDDFRTRILYPRVAAALDGHHAQAGGNVMDSFIDSLPNMMADALAPAGGDTAEGWASFIESHKRARLSIDSKLRTSPPAVGRQSPVAK